MEERVGKGLGFSGEASRGVTDLMACLGNLKFHTVTGRISLLGDAFRPGLQAARLGSTQDHSEGKKEVTSTSQGIS
jgi:hypothetical protein